MNAKHQVKPRATQPREQVPTGLVVYPIYRADGRVVWVTIPKSR